MVKDAARARFCIAVRTRRRYFYGIALRGAHQCRPGHDITAAWRRILKEVFRGVSLFSTFLSVAAIEKHVIFLIA